METYNEVDLAGWNAEVYHFVTKCGILIIYDEPLTKPVKYNFVKVFVFDVPIAGHTWSEFVPLCFGDVQC